MARRPAALAALLGLLAACGQRQSAPVPDWRQFPLAPDELARIEALAAEELERWTRERDEALIDAIDPGERAEHARRLRREAILGGEVRIGELFLQGEAIFERDFTLPEGLGTGLLGRPRPALSRVENRAPMGGPDALSCGECHGRGGDDGHGELHQRAWLDGDGRHLSTARPRLPPHLAGLGLLQRLAEEMSAELQEELTVGRAVAKQSGRSRVPLASRGVSFGEVTIDGDGRIDTTGRRGIDADLVIKPFGWKGTQPTLRAFVRGALPQHLGLEPPPGAPPPGPPPRLDGDRDGVADELHEGQLLALVAYLALLDVPVVLPPRSPPLAQAWERGVVHFRTLGCGDCHRPELTLKSTAFTDGGVEFDLIRDNQVAPALEQLDYSRPLAVRLYSDLRRHDLGPALAERSEGGAGPREFLTRPLWGLGDRGPYYLHDGRARSLRAAILAHGGEAAAQAAAFARLSTVEARELELFLLSLRRAPQGRIAP